MREGGWRNELGAQEVPGMSEPSGKVELSAARHGREDGRGRLLPGGGRRDRMRGVSKVQSWRGWEEEP